MSRRQRKRREKQRRHPSTGRLDPRRRQLAAGAGVTIGATLAMGGVAHAACTCTVDSLLDPTDTGHTTLSDAITSANSNPGSTITFASGLSGTITLGSQLPTITQPTTITGPGASQLAVSGNHLHRILRINAPGATVAISGLTLTDGSVTGGGAGINSIAADLTVTNAVISGNTVTGGFSGAGIYAPVGTTLTIVGSTISGNNAGLGGRGGGVYTADPSGPTATIRSSTIEGNQASAFGGGAYFNAAKPAAVENSTIYGNTSQYGGGLYDYGQPGGGTGLTVTGSTITHNTANRGGGVASYGNPTKTQPTLRNTIVAGNTATVTGPDLSAVSGSMSAAFSLIGSVDPKTTINQTGPNIFGQDPQLGPLASNGGPTQTQMPAASSPVIDKGSAFDLTTDQRGSGRPFEVPSIPNAAGGDGSDIGAVELQASELPSNAFTLGKPKGKKLPVNVSVPGTVDVSDAGAPLAAGASKKRKLFLNPSGATGGPPTILVPLRLTKLAKQQLRQKGKVSVKARVSFTPKYGLARTVTAKLKIKSKRK